MGAALSVKHALNKKAEAGPVYPAQPPQGLLSTDSELSEFKVYTDREALVDGEINEVGVFNVAVFEKIRTGDK